MPFLPIPLLPTPTSPPSHTLSTLSTPQARLNFTRTNAVWCMTGHMLGLGDRHGENLLIDTASGDTVHVDFGCLFDRGLALEVPEMVPFRLTQNVIDSFGVSGVEGAFRKCAEITLQVRRGGEGGGGGREARGRGGGGQR